MSLTLITNGTNLNLDCFPYSLPLILFNTYFKFNIVSDFIVMLLKGYVQ